MTSALNDRETVCVVFDAIAPEKSTGRTRREPVVAEVRAEVGNLFLWPTPDHLTDDDRWEPEESYTTDPESVRFPEVYGFTATEAEIDADTYSPGTLALVGGTVWRKYSMQNSVFPVRWYPVNIVVSDTSYPNLRELALAFGTELNGPVFILHHQASA